MKLKRNVIALSKTLPNNRDNEKHCKKTFYFLKFTISHFFYKKRETLMGFLPESLFIPSPCHEFLNLNRSVQNSRDYHAYGLQLNFSNETVIFIS